jgi:hypothetical protein
MGTLVCSQLVRSTCGGEEEVEGLHASNLGIQEVKAKGFQIQGLPKLA